MLKKKNPLNIVRVSKGFFFIPIGVKALSFHRYVHLHFDPTPTLDKNDQCQTNIWRKKPPQYLCDQEHLQYTERTKKYEKTWSFKGNIFCCFSVNLREVREVRDGKNSKDFDRWPEEARKYDPSVCFVILYGNDFKLKTLSVAGKSPP